MKNMNHRTLFVHSLPIIICAFSENCDFVSTLPKVIKVTKSFKMFKDLANLKPKESLPGHGQ